MKKCFLLFIAAMLLMMPQVLKADGFPRYYELVTDASQLESGKYYVIIGIPTPEDLKSDIQFRIAYNGLNTSEHKGNAGSVTPNALYEQPGITASQFSGIIDIEKAGNAAKPLKMTINTAETEELKYTVWNFVDESVGTSNQLVGVNAETTEESQHYLIGSEASNTNVANHYHLWTITFHTDWVEIRNVGKTYYLKYDANSYGAAAGLFRVYTSTASEKRNVMLYKEMETITAETYFTGHGTLYYSNKVLMVPADVEAMTMTYDAKKKEVDCSTLYATGSFIPAGSAVVLHNTRDESTFPDIGSADTYTFPVTTRHAPTLDNANILSGLLDEYGYTTTGGNDNDYYFYKMTTKNNTNPGFYWANNDGSRFKMPNNSNKAYLALKKDDAKNVRSFLLDFIKTPTSINQIPSPNTKHPSPDGDVFDLSGRRVSTSQSLPKGIYISNGKKFVVK